MKNRNEIFKDWIGILGSIASIIGLFLPLLTAGFLSIQDEPLRVESLNFRLGIWYQIILLLCAFVVLIHLLQRHWRNKRYEKSYSHRFKFFLLADIPNRNPILVIPFILIAGSIFYISWIAGLIILIGFLIYYDNCSYEIKWNKDSNYRKRWNKRIDSLLSKNQEVLTKDFYDVGASKNDYDEINFLLEKYFEINESRNNSLKITPLHLIEQDENGNRTYVRRLFLNE